MEPDAWVDINYTPDGVAQVAECTYQERRLIVGRRTASNATPARRR